MKQPTAKQTPACVSNAARMTAQAQRRATATLQLFLWGSHYDNGRAYAARPLSASAQDARHDVRSTTNWSCGVDSAGVFASRASAVNTVPAGCTPVDTSIAQLVPAAVGVTPAPSTQI